MGHESCHRIQPADWLSYDSTSPDKINRTINDFGIFDMGWIWALYGTLGIDVCWKMMPRGMGIDSTLGQDFRDFAFWDRFLRNQLFAISV